MSVRWREDRQKWEACIVVRGKRLRPLFNTKREAEEADRRAKLKRYDLDSVEQKRLRLAEACPMYFKEVSAGKSVSSKAGDRWYFNLKFHFLTEERGLEFVDEISLQDLEGLQRWLQPARELKELDPETGETKLRKKAEWSAATNNRAFHTYDHFFNKMCAWGYLKESPARFLKSLAEAPVKREPITRGMYEQILAHKQTSDWFKDVLEFMWQYGARGTSIERFTWDRVDFKARQLELDTRKGAAAATKLIPLPMTDKVFALLIRIRNRWPEATGSVFRYDNGQPVRADVISKAGTRALRACGFVNVDLYGARHGLASELISAGVEIELVRQLLGHATTKTTQNYTKSTSMKTLENALQLVRGDDLPPNATTEETKVAVASGDSE